MVISQNYLHIVILIILSNNISSKFLRKSNDPIPWSSSPFHTFFNKEIFSITEFNLYRYNKTLQSPTIIPLISANIPMGQSSITKGLLNGNLVLACGELNMMTIIEVNDGIIIASIPNKTPQDSDNGCLFAQIDEYNFIVVNQNGLIYKNTLNNENVLEETYNTRLSNYQSGNQLYRIDYNELSKEIAIIYSWASDLRIYEEIFDNDLVSLSNKKIYDQKSGIVKVVRGIDQSIVISNHEQFNYLIGCKVTLTTCQQFMEYRAPAEESSAFIYDISFLSIDTVIIIINQERKFIIQEINIVTDELIASFALQQKNPNDIIVQPLFLTSNMFHFTLQEMPLSYVFLFNFIHCESMDKIMLSLGEKYFFIKLFTQIYESNNVVIRLLNPTDMPCTFQLNTDLPIGTTGFTCNQLGVFTMNYSFKISLIDNDFDSFSITASDKAVITTGSCIANVIVCVQYCERCQDVDICQECKTGYYLDNNICKENLLREMKCDELCQKCNVIDPDKCDMCYYRFTPNNIIEHRIICITQEEFYRRMKELIKSPTEHQNNLYQLYPQNKLVYVGDSIIYVREIYDFDNTGKGLRILSSTTGILNVSSLDLNVEKIKRCHHILSNEFLLLATIDTIEENQISNKLIFQVFTKEGRLLSVSSCDDVYPFIMTIPINTVDTPQGKEILFYHNKGIDVFNQTHPFFNNRCTPFTTDTNTDITLQDRRKVLFKKTSLICPENCIYTRIDFEKKRVHCLCYNNHENAMENSHNFTILKEKLIGIFPHSNFDVINCYNLVFDFVIAKKNLGLWLMVVILIISIVCICFYAYYDSKKNNIDFDSFLHDKYAFLLSKRRDVSYRDRIPPQPEINENHQTEQDLKVSQENQNQDQAQDKELEQEPNNQGNNYMNENLEINAIDFQVIDNKIGNGDEITMTNNNNNDLIMTPSSQSLGSTSHQQNLENEIQPPKFSTTTTTESTPSNVINETETERNNHHAMKYSFEEMNEFSYKEAIEQDHRNIFLIYFGYLMSTQPILYTFFLKSKLNIRILQVSLFFLSLITDFSLSAFFYSDDYISLRYHNGGGINSFKDNYSISFYTYLLGMIVSLLFILLSSTVGNDCFYNINSYRKLIVLMPKMLFVYKLKLCFYFSFYIVYCAFCCYHIVAFCAVYQNHQVQWLKAALFSFCLTMIVPIAYSIVFALLRLISIKLKIKWVYKALQLMMLLIKFV